MDRWIISDTVELTAIRVRQPVHANPVPLMVPGDALGHVWQVTVLFGGEAADLSDSTANGYFLRTDGTTVVVPGTINDNVVTVVLSENCYYYSGPLRGVVKLTDGDGRVISLVDETFVIRSDTGDTLVDPEDVFPSLHALAEQVSDLDQTVTAMVAAMVDTIYPVGSIYMSTANTSPATLFPGTAWTQIKDTFLLSAGDTYNAGDTGGAAEHTHEYGFQIGAYYSELILESNANAGALAYDENDNISIQGASSYVTGKSANVNGSTSNSRKSVNADYGRYKGNTSYESNLPPYLAVYMWRRTA